MTVIVRDARRDSLLPLWEKVPEGRMRGERLARDPRAICGAAHV
jgi:hypothetical protein